jgi:Amt family ammonium transporter
MKHKLKYDDSLDVFGVHGVGGIIGSILVGVFATSSVSKTATDPGISGLLEGNHQLLLIQIAGVVFSIAFCAAGTWIALKITGAICGLRVSAEEEREGLDLSLHGEALHQ